MKVRQLIEMLLTMPQDHDVVFGVSNHVSDRGESSAVGVGELRNYGIEVVAVGDWTWVTRHPECGVIVPSAIQIPDGGTYLMCRTSGEIVKMRLKLEPARRVPVTKYETIEAQMRSEPVEEYRAIK